MFATLKIMLKHSGSAASKKKTIRGDIDVFWKFSRNLGEFRDV